MSNIFLILGIIETILVVLFANHNASNVLNLSLNGTDMAFSVGLFIFTILIYVLGVIAGILIMLKGLMLGSKKINSTKRMLEKQSVNTDDYELKIRALENKVQTLEVALDKALNKNN